MTTKRTFVIDRFEEGFAVLEDTATLETISLPRAALPKGAKRGDVIDELDDGTLHVNKQETNLRAARIREKFNRLVKR